MANRHKLIEILEARESRTNNATAELSMRLIAIETAYEKCDTENKELLRYFPIALVACIESFFRQKIKELIDSGEPYLSKSQELMPNERLDFDILKGLYGKKITIGDVIAHSMSISKLAHIITPMNKLMEHIFKKKISQIHDRWAVEVEGNPKSSIIADVDETFKYVEKTFELRHIFCHETASRFEMNKNEIDKCFNHSIVFLKALDALIWQTLFPDAPLTQMEMNVAASKTYKKEKELLDSVLEDALNVLSDKQKIKFREANKAWNIFFQASVEIEGLRYEGGSIRPTIENSIAAQYARNRRKQIKRLIKLLAQY